MNILDYCKEKGISIAKFAKELGKHQTAITRLAKGTRGASKELYEKIHQIEPRIEFIQKEAKNHRTTYMIKNPSGLLKKEYKAGDTIGYLTITEDTGKRNNCGHIIWKCKCICGKEAIRSSATLYSSIYQNCKPSCGCMKPKDVGKRELYNPIRIKRAREKQGIVDGTMLCNIQRKNMNKNNTSGVRGVYWLKREQKWCASLEFKRKDYKKLFNTKEEAIKHRKYLEDTYFKPILNKYGR